MTLVRTVIGSRGAATAFFPEVVWTPRGLVVEQRMSS
jgi:hypothetical protein